MEIRVLPIEQINAAAYNPRVDLQPGDPEYEKLKASIQSFGYVEPIVWNERTGNMVGGHQRYKIMVNELGHTELAVSIVNLDDQQERLLNLALNKVGGSWDDQALYRLLDDLQVSGANLALSGFDLEEFEDLAAEFAVPHDEALDLPVTDDDFDVQRALDEIKEPETRRGEVWQLGRHRLVCGDATNPDDVALLMDGAKAALVVTDPPYNVAVESVSERLAADGRSSIMNDNMPAEDFAGFLFAVFSNYAVVMQPTAAIYVFHPSSYQREFEDAMNAASIVVRTQCVWVKNAATFGWAQYRFKHEPVFYAHMKGKSPAWYGDRTQTTVWKAGLPVEDPLPETVWEVSRGDVNKYVHPTQKPLDLLAIPIKNSSQRGDEVADFFGGSGSTLMTCEQMDRTCRTLELDPIFCDVIKKRFLVSTGIEPVLLHRDEPVA
ncbi:site-specific DNA-methyltransferase [Paenibacillus sp. P2(2022)]|uniref:site-specific DNA-methyltransferase n=1 Tax=Paenibacillus TaxID=44249 RepID=UPI001C9DBEA4|nr:MULTISPECIES: site-specific DNA-methyltransferase [Paenibacillus]MBY7736734.1 DNA modification methylase [Paenibacillus polymyxa]MDG0053443.1 site-specific DNA-methyltransferase [Paenibacillus sp. P2(2022)]